MLELNKVIEILNKIKNVKVAVYGDFGIDAYWILDPDGSEISVETRLKGEAVKEHYYKLGGASNIVANLASLNCASIFVIGVIGDDIFGREITRQFQKLGVIHEYLVIQKENFSTVTFGKRYLEGEEKTRIDFGFFNKRSELTNNILIEGIHHALKLYDVLIFNQQVPGSITSKSFINQINALFQKFKDKIILLDTRHYGKEIKNIYIKTNVYEAASLLRKKLNDDNFISVDNIKRYSEILYKLNKKPVFITRGLYGITVFDSEGFYEIPGIELLKQRDTVGAGDTTTSSLALSLAAGESPQTSAEFANLAATVVVQKLYQTGTASADEIIETYKNANYIYNIELSRDLKKAKYFKNTEIELCASMDQFCGREIKHAIFDHDGTISTLRQGWENVMEPLMIKTILGKNYNTVSESLLNKIRDHVKNYVENSTGIQTILQMEVLVDMVKEFKFVPENEILDKFGYKKIYNDKLIELVQNRIEKLMKNEFDVNDFTVKGALKLLRLLRERGVKLYLTSGTDYEDVINESKVLGYAELFDGGIFGAIDDISICSKKMVIEKIMMENNLSGRELIVFGDGPVEMRECRKSNGLAVGVASDEIRRYGLNFKKRARLIKGGADIIIPDFSKFEILVDFLFSMG